MDTHIDAEYSEPISEANLAIAVREESPIAMPLVTNEQAKEAMQAYIDLCKGVLTDDDYQMFRQWNSKTRQNEEKRFIKKSGVKKLQVFFGISVRIKETVMDQMPDGHFGFRVTATATRKNGDSTDATGACSTIEERFTPEQKADESDPAYRARVKKARNRAYHDILGTAETRSTNRAIMNAIGVGGGEVTADEMPHDQRATHHVQARSSNATKRKETPPAADDHTAQLRYALNSYLAFAPDADSKDAPRHLMNVIVSQFSLADRPKRWSDVAVDQLKWAGDHFTSLKQQDAVAA
jgi:hypothetical protein